MSIVNQLKIAVNNKDLNKVLELFTSSNLQKLRSETLQQERKDTVLINMLIASKKAKDETEALEIIKEINNGKYKS